MSIAILTDDEFDTKVVKSKKPVLVDFWANWCGPCKMFMPTIEMLATEMSSSIDFFKMDVDENPRIPSELGIRSVPNLVIYKDGKMIQSRVGGADKVTIKNWIEESIK